MGEEGVEKRATAKKLEEIVREFLRWDQDLDEDQIARQFEYETGEKPDRQEVSRIVVKVIRGISASW